ncbi:hypothetical protein NX801_22720 [Streptomyces sp. LP05-1]|uniref:Uncharacterized protein n=1 Tax=Streptomyces pyxinae TaxID=2970734 RepID=A0ABT2CP05_9ACTN|nr:hypothetical protein [Streptomyces sp. LP05-1]MCS0638416.1 hypothetical protein [Streptomyces sp. LP05-1]
MDQSGPTTRLSDAVRDLAAQVVSALRSGGHSPVGGAFPPSTGDDEITVAAVRVLGADTLLPDALSFRPADPAAVALVARAVRAFPPGASPAPTTAWSHWAMAGALRRLAPGSAEPGGSGEPGGATAEPDTAWLEYAPWPVLTHQLAVLAALAVPGCDSGIARVAAARPVDVARGFVRAVRRRDWLQAAGAGRWLTLLDGVPDTLGLGTGLEFVGLMGGTDPRVVLHLRAAGLLRTGVPV